MKGLIVNIGCTVLIAAAATVAFTTTPDMGADALADTLYMSGSCSSTAVTTFVPTISYAISQAAAPVAGSALSLTKTVTISSAINGDINPSATTATAAENYIRVHFNAPMMKASGLNCQAENGATVSVKDSVGGDIAQLDAYAATSTPTFSAGEKIDTISDKHIYGPTNTLVQATGLKDANDVLGQNGEVVFGGASNSINGQGGFKMGLAIKAFNNFWSGTVNEDLSITFGLVTLP